MAEEAEKVRSLKKSKDKEKEANGEPATPRKQKTLPYRDGFDDDEIQIISPSKFHIRKSNPGTPTKIGTKRKRKGQESPIVPLQVEEDERAQQGQESTPGVINDLLLERIREPDDRLSVSTKVVTLTKSISVAKFHSSWRQSSTTGHVEIILEPSRNLPKLLSQAHHKSLSRRLSLGSFLAYRNNLRQTFQLNSANFSFLCGKGA